jgi:hypothetical protein
MDIMTKNNYELLKFGGDILYSLEVPVEPVKSPACLKDEESPSSSKIREPVDKFYSTTQFQKTLKNY